MAGWLRLSVRLLRLSERPPRLNVLSCPLAAAAALSAQLSASLQQQPNPVRKHKAAFKSFADALYETDETT